MGKFEGRYCCECDYCGLGDCHGGVDVVLLTDSHVSNNYYQFCKTHSSHAQQIIRKYMAEHPDVVVDISDGVEEDGYCDWEDKETNRNEVHVIRIAKQGGVKFIYSREDNGIIAIFPEDPQISGFGRTSEEAIAHLLIALRGCYEALKERLDDDHWLGEDA